ncbi:receptor activity-modifying protein 1 [Grus japonensis]|uniref:Receptor activity-modifying protein 1 n=1 Tax=Grus japonensis TaxID=30415 RepID=A0ABC9X302_GRUJA
MLGLLPLQHPLKTNRFHGDEKTVLLVVHISTYGELTNCTALIAERLDCYWPNRLVDEFFVAIHKQYFRNCSPSGRALHDPPNGVLCPFILLPILITLLMTALVVWRSKRSEGIV